MARTLIRVGHKGAGHVAPGNTAASFEAALACGVDMIEFDVLPLQDGRLVLAHDYDDAASRTPLTLDEGLDHLADPGYDGIDLDVDLKLPGYEQAVLDALQSRDLIDRALVSSTYPDSLKLIGRLEAGIRRGLSVPRAQRDYTKSPLLVLPAYAVITWMRSVLPGRAERAIRAGECEAIMAFRMLVSPRLVQAVHRAGGQVYVWTVDDAAEIKRLERMGVDAVITNDPRLFGA